MNIEEFITGEITQLNKLRILTLSELGTPERMISDVKMFLDTSTKGNLKISGDKKLLAETYLHHVYKKDSEGVLHTEINDNINFFPYAKHGMYIELKRK